MILMEDNTRLSLKIINFKRGTSMKYSIVIAFYKNIRMLSSCITSVGQALKNTDAEIIIVNDNPDIDLRTWKAEGKTNVPVSIISLEKNSGHSVACNRGVSESRGEYIVLLDSDIIVTPNWLTELEKTYFNHSGCGGAESTILRISDRSVEYYGMFLYKTETIKPYQNSMQNKLYLLNDRQSQIITAGSMMIKKELYLKIGGLKPEFYNSCNDLDLSMEIIKAGYTNYCSAKSVVYHRGNASGNIRFTSHMYARALFFKRWGNSTDDALSLKLLARLYGEQPCCSGTYLVLNLSSSICVDDYLNCLKNVYNLTYLDIYQIRAASSASHICLMDYLSWGICEYSVPLLYFTDNFRSIFGNDLWFQLRNNKEDVVADRNGNLCLANPLHTRTQ